MMMQSLWSAAWFAMAIWSCAAATTDSGPASDADAPGDSPYNPLPYGHPYPGLPSYQQPFHQSDNIKIVYVEKPSSPNSGGYGQPYHPHPHPEPYRPEDPKANCTLEEVKREEEICGPGRLDKECQIVKVDYMKISTEEQCYDVTRTICEESVVEEDREICTYEFKHTERKDSAKGVEVKFSKSKRTKNVDVCHKIPVRGYGYVKTYENVCSKADQTTETTSPSVASKSVTVGVSGPEIVRTCITKRMTTPMIDCRDETESKCTMAPKILDSTEDVEVCEYNLGPEECRDAKLYLPVQKCTERTEEKSHHHYHTT